MEYKVLAHKAPMCLGDWVSHTSRLLGDPCHHHPDPAHPHHGGHVHRHDLQPHPQALGRQRRHPGQ